MLDILVNPSSMTPIYEQIVERIRALVARGDLPAGAPLPSVRALARQCRISALTVKKAYDVLETEGLVVTVQGKGSFVADISPNIVAEEANRQVEERFVQAIAQARRAGLADHDIVGLVAMLLEDDAEPCGEDKERKLP
ncbi:GntR family transcriptional regulator [Bifidobacterium cuniculi]|uniref:Regulatory protein GntR n=1 Tax=Bifidobacterium cuniculi TaxID=1688 RepID=A0A087B3U8_9BIFI|nr:GntR family transcriptional regulator [Bifidobacterium cuniculi]KFI65698.1 regulatory protein GntR [Bifidobacterium cuniculi]